MRLGDILICLLVTGLWGLNYIAIKIGVDAFTPILTMCIRYSIVSILLLPWIIRIRKAHLRPLFMLAFFLGFLYFSLFFIGTHGVSASEAVIIVQLQTPFSALLSWLILKEPLPPRTMLGIMIAFVGVVIAIGVLPTDFGRKLSIVFLMSAAFFWALSNVYARKLNHLHPLQLNGAIAMMALPFLMLLSWIITPHTAYAHALHLPFKAYAALLYMIVVSNIICYSLWFHQLKKYEVSKVVPFSLLMPIFTLIASNLIMHEVITLHIIIGCLISIAGIALIVVKSREKKVLPPIE